MGLLDYLGGTGGLLPFDQQWMLANGAQSQPGTGGYSAFPGYLPITQGAPGYNGRILPQDDPQGAFASAPGGAPMPSPQPAGLGGGGILPGGPQQPQSPQMPLWMQAGAQGTPPGIQPAQPPQPPQGGLGSMLGGLFGIGGANAQGAPSGSPGIGDRLNAGLMGFANGGAPIPALANLISGLATGQRSDPRGMMLEHQAAIEKALIANGVPATAARAASFDPKILAMISPQLKLIKNALGEEIPYLWSQQTSSLKPVNTGDGGTALGAGQPQSTPAGANPISASADPRTSFARDPNDEVMDRLVAAYGKDAPAVKAAAKAYINGDVMPTGNPRQTALAQHGKSIAQQWGQATGEDVSDARFTAMRNMQNEYSSGRPTSLGGQRNAGNTAIRHLGELSKAAADLENWSLPGGVLPSVAHFINSARQEGTDEQKAKANGLADVLDRYVTEVGRFYAGSSSGGVGEREAARQRFSSAKTPKELAAAIQYERDLMHGKLQQMEDQRDQTFEGRTVPRIIGDIIQPRAKAALEDIETNLGRLKGTTPKQPAPGNAELPRPATPEEARKLKPGTRFIDPDGVERVR